MIFVSWWQMISLQIWFYDRKLIIDDVSAAGDSSLHPWPLVWRELVPPNLVSRPGGDCAENCWIRWGSVPGERLVLLSSGKYLLLIGWHKAILISDWLLQNKSNLWLVVFRILCCQWFTMMQWFTIRSENMAMMLFTHWDQVNTGF